MYVLLHAEPSGLNGGGNQHCPPPQIFCWKLANSLPPPPPPCNSPPKCLQQIFCYQFVAALQFPEVYPAPSNTVAATNALPLNISVTKHSPPQMPAADVLRPVCCCPPISCGAPCTLYPAAQLQLPTPAPLMVVPPPPNFLLPVPCSEMANSLAPPPPPLQQTLCHLCFLRPQPPQMPAADFLLPVCCCPPISCGVPCTPQHSCSLPTPAPFMAVSPPPPNFRLQTPEGASSRFSAASSLLLRPAHVPTQKTSSSKFVTVLVSVVGVADAQDQGKRCLTQSPAPFGCDWRGAAVWQFSPLPI